MYEMVSLYAQKLYNEKNGCGGVLTSATWVVCTGAVAPPVL